MINFDGTILMDIMSTSSPGEPGPDNVDGVDVYKYVLLPEEERYERVCEGCGAAPWNGSMFNMYDSIPLTPESLDTMTPVLTYCQACMEDLKRVYDDNPYNISGYGKINGAPWWRPMLLSGEINGKWRTF